MLLQQNFNRVLIFNLAALNLRQISGPGAAVKFKSSLLGNLSYSCRYAFIFRGKNIIIPVPLTFFQMNRPWQKFHY